jgi:hypothetical protein
MGATPAVIGLVLLAWIATPAPGSLAAKEAQENRGLDDFPELFH